MRITIIYMVSFLLITVTLLSGQTTGRDIREMEKKLPQTSGKERTDMLNDLAQDYAFISVEKSFEYSGKALKLALKLDDPGVN